jgi:hypothetical protein
MWMPRHIRPNSSAPAKDQSARSPLRRRSASSIAINSQGSHAALRMMLSC